MMLLRLQHFDTAMASFEDLMPRGVYLFVEGNEGEEEWMCAMVLERTIPHRVWKSVMGKWVDSFPAEAMGRNLAEENGITLREFKDLKDMAGAIAGGMALLVYGRDGSVLDRRQPVEDEEEASEAEEATDA